jgi:hypothetical protein
VTGRIRAIGQIVLLYASVTGGSSAVLLYLLFVAFLGEVFMGNVVIILQTDYNVHNL